jgi:hypothetical protein
VSKSSSRRLQGGIPRNPAAAVCEGDDPSGAVERNFSRAAQAERQTNGRAELPRDPGLLPMASLCLSQIESAPGLPDRPQGEALLTAPSPSLSHPLLPDSDVLFGLCFNLHLSCLNLISFLPLATDVIIRLIS